MPTFFIYFLMVDEIHCYSSHVTRYLTRKIFLTPVERRKIISYTNTEKNSSNVILRLLAAEESQNVQLRFFVSLRMT